MSSRGLCRQRFCGNLPQSCAQPLRDLAGKEKLVWGGNDRTGFHDPAQY